MHSSMDMDRFSFKAVFLIDMNELNFVFLIAAPHDILADYQCSEIVDD
jgi:hypothetical protein